jgi:carboxypeptidase C (cathepsin A)
MTVHSIYLDQPVGAGFSHGTKEVGTTQQAAVDVYTFLQMFFTDDRFKKYAPHDFAIWTES